MKYLAPLAIGASVLAAYPAFAQTSAEGLYYSGFLQGEYYDSSGSNEHAFYGDGTIGFKGPAGGSLGWGAEVSLEALHFQGENYKVWNPVVFLDSDYGRFTVGAPKSVAETYGIPDKFQSNGLFAVEFGTLFGSIPKLVALEQDDVVLGTSYDYMLGNTKFGLSYHRYTESGDHLNMYALGVRHSFDMVDVFATYEKAKASSLNEDSFTVGAEGHYAALDYGIEYKNGLIVEPSVDTTYAYVDYNVNDKFVVGGEIAHLSGGGSSDNLYSINADYTFWQNAYIGASYIDGSGFDRVYSARLGWKF